MNELDFCKAYIAYANAMINANRLPLNSDEYAEQMSIETENLHTDAEISLNININ